MKILENLWQSSETFGKLRKQFKSVFQHFKDFFKFSENLRKSSESFRKLRKRFKSNFQMFFRLFKICGKSSGIFGKFPDVIGHVRNESQQLKRFGAGF